ncbi:MAG: hypothetical protein ACF788_11180 [Novipirellula sp. JB048]
MLLLPLLLLWARTPMYFSRSLMGCLIPTTSLIAVLTPLFVIALDGEARGLDRFASEVSPPPLGSAHPAGARFATESQPFGGKADQATNTHLAAFRHQLRDGAILPPVSGQIAMSGRRWLFIPTPQNESYDTFSQKRLHQSVTESRQSLRSSSASIVFESSLQSFAESVTPAPSYDEPKSFELVENLVLERVVNAIRADANDDQWTITARATEFFNSNRLILLTAQRSER